MLERDVLTPMLVGRLGWQLGYGDYAAFTPIEAMRWFGNIPLTSGFTLLAEMLGGNTTLARPAFIEIGNHGDYVGAVDTGVRVPPQASDTGVRNALFRKAILEASFSGNTAILKTFLTSFEGNATDINEFALLSADERGYSHVVTPETGPGGPATKLVKNEGLNALLVYEIEIQPC